MARPMDAKAAPRRRQVRVVMKLVLSSTWGLSWARWMLRVSSFWLCFSKLARVWVVWALRFVLRSVSWEERWWMSALSSALVTSWMGLGMRGSFLVGFGR